MLRTALLSTIAACGLASAAPAQVQLYAQVAPRPSIAVNVGRYHETRYDVMYRSCDREPWQTYTSTCNRVEARKVAHQLRHQRFESRVHRCN